MRYESYAYGRNHYLLDPDLEAILTHAWPEAPLHRSDLEAFGELAGTEAYEVGFHVDREAHPVLVTHDLDGNRVDRVRLSPAQTALLKRLAPIMEPPYRGSTWAHHYALGYLLADPGLYCILTITQQVAYAIHKYAPEHAAWKERLLAGDAWGATWMTEIQGGSDLGANRTVAIPKGASWRLSGGDKYFASGAGMADLALVTARPEGAPDGPKGLALFLVPRLRADGTLNYRVRRLKEKSATRAVPSGEVEIEGSEGWLVGTPGEGIYTTLEILTSSRLANAVAAMGIAKKAQLETLFRVGRRRAFGKRIMEHPLVRRDLVELAARQAAGLALAFHAVAAFDQSWRDRPPYTPAYHYARFLSHLAKSRTADHAAETTRMAMELFGGLGFLEEYALARWHREALITPIWEGTANIQALDLLEAMAKKRAHEAFLAEFVPMLERAGTPEAKGAREALEASVARLSAAPPEEAQWQAKHATRRMADAASVGLLYDLAGAFGDRYASLAALYAHRFLDGEEIPSWAMTDPGLISLPEIDEIPSGTDSSSS